MIAEPLSAEWVDLELKRLGRGSGARLVEFMRGNGHPSFGADFPSKMRKGTRSIQPGEIAALWEFFGHPAATLPQALGMAVPAVATPDMAPPPRSLPNAGLPETISFVPERLPVLGSSVGGKSGRQQFNNQRLGSVGRPKGLEFVPNAYGSYVHGDSMMPRYEPGEIVCVNPQRAISRGAYVVAQIYDNDGDPPYGYVKQFISIDDKELVLRQLNPPDGEGEFLSFERNRVLSVHRIVGTIDEDG